MAALLALLTCAALVAVGASPNACHRWAGVSEQGCWVPALGGVSDDPSSLLQYRTPYAAPAKAAPRSISSLRAPAPQACPARNDVLESWVGLGLRVFVFDAASLGPVARALFGGAAWWDTYEAWAAAPATFPLASRTAGDPESPAAAVQAGLQPALEARSPQIEIVGDPEDADLVLWNVWDIALCLASGHQAEDWELAKGRLAQSCEAHFALLAWLTETPRWRRHHGRDHVLFVDFPYFWESYTHFKPKPLLPLHHTVADMQAVLRITRNATMIGVEDARLRLHRGASTFVAVPYFVNSSVYQALAVQDREHLVGFAASSELYNWSSCESCDLDLVNNSGLRAKIFEDLKTHCAEGECEVYDLTQILSSSSGKQRANMSFYDSADVSFVKVVQGAVFCPIPRGDSWTSKRLFMAILGGCIPVVLSDAIVLPFAPATDYRGAMLLVPEARMMSPGFSLVAFLRSQPPRKVAAMQARLACIRDSITFRPDCAPSAGPGACPGSAMDFLVASLVHLAHHPWERFDVTAGAHLGSEALP